MPDLDMVQQNDSVIITVKVIPGSSKTAFAGTLDKVLKVKVAAPPEKGKANSALIAFFAENFGIKKRAVTVISGKTSTIKQLRVDGVKLDYAKEKLSSLLEPTK
jgi:uncharacterized protein